MLAGCLTRRMLAQATQRSTLVDTECAYLQLCGLHRLVYTCTLNANP